VKQAFLFSVHLLSLLGN